MFMSSGNGLAPCGLFGFGLLAAGAVLLGDDGEDAGLDGACAPRQTCTVPQEHANANAARTFRFITFCNRFSIAPSMLGCEA